MHVVGLYFGWPAGAVYSNLLASAICVGLAWWRLRAKMIAHHLEQLAQRERHHDELKQHVTAAVAARTPPKRLVPRPAPQGPGGDQP